MGEIGPNPNTPMTVIFSTLSPKTRSQGMQLQFPSAQQGDRWANPGACKGIFFPFQGQTFSTLDFPVNAPSI
ncbi:conserved hypothetical protein [Ricinus communis]|uniref:Uncharacterized protein n=1 Tax=Ricinus communis TaxID=3988 RepID=B9SHB3_RICCO|nr:conserved hypothetical protein [Ricinus communis]